MLVRRAESHGDAPIEGMLVLCWQTFCHGYRMFMAKAT